MSKTVIDETLYKICIKSNTIQMLAFKIRMDINYARLSEQSIKELKTQIGLLLILKEELP